MGKRILVVDDDVEIVNLIEVYLKSEGYITDKAYNGEDAVNMSKENDYDLIILDVMMPILDGIKSCMKIREFSRVPIIFLSAKGEEIHKIEGLTVGADDYVCKPFSSLELIARVKSQIRRYRMFNETNNNKDIIEIEDLIIKFNTHEVFVRGESVKLTPKEFSILETLAKNKGVVFSMEKLYEAVWNEKFSVSDTSIVVHITNLRQKIEDDPKFPKYIKTVWGVGYKI